MMIETISTDTRILETCPTFIVNEQDEFIVCNAPLRVVCTRSIVGDDYGSWPVVSVEFECGHTFSNMVASLSRESEV